MAFNKIHFAQHRVATYLAMMLAFVLMLRVIWFGTMWFRRRKVAELNEVTRLLEETENNE